MLNGLEIPTERSGVFLKEMLSETDDKDWLLTIRECPHPLPPDNSSAPDYVDFVARRAVKLRPEVTSLGIRSNGVLVGIVTVTLLDQEQKLAEIGWKVATRYQRQGFATLGAQAASRYMSTEAGYQRLVAQIHESNLTSQHVAQRAGYIHIAARAGMLLYRYMG